jgi:hypothetical protein
MLIMIKHDYCGVIGYKNGDIELYTHNSSLNLTNELKYYWQNEIPVHMTIKSDVRNLLNETDELVYEKDEKGKWKLHINGRNVDQILRNAYGKKIEVTIEMLNAQDSDTEEATDGLQAASNS